MSATVGDRPDDAELREALDKLAIDELHSRYVWAINWQDADTVAACFAPDGVLDWAGGVVAGRENIRREVFGMRDWFGKLAAADAPLHPARLSRLDAGFGHVSGDKPSKEVYMHRAFYQARPDASAVVHLHSTMATAVACLADVDPVAPMPALTPYFVMRVGRRLPVVPYYRPGDPAMEPAIAEAARDARAVLLANHGPVVSARTLTDAVNTAEELEEAAKLFMLLRGSAPRALTPAQVEDLLTTFG